MIILDEKMTLPPPPPYVPPSPVIPLSPPPFPHQSYRQQPSLTTIPSSILLRIVYETFSKKVPIQKQRKTLYWLNVSLRAVCRATYVACMHVLRSTYLSAYTTLVRPPYSSDPFPHPSSPYFLSSPVLSAQRETRVLDLFISLKVREDVWADDTELHLERDESFRDLFDLMQPKSRLEDLLKSLGVREGVISVDSPVVRGSFSSPPTPTNTSSSSLATLVNASTPLSGTQSRKPATPISFTSLAASFSSRRVGIVLTTKERKKTIVEVERTRDEKLEVAAKRLVQELKVWLASNVGSPSCGCPSVRR